MGRAVLWTPVGLRLDDASGDAAFAALVDEDFADGFARDAEDGAGVEGARQRFQRLRAHSKPSNLPP
jgi:hypothetical protein